VGQKGTNDGASASLGTFFEVSEAGFVPLRRLLHQKDQTTHTPKKWT
jgi:hypothetical protein